MRTIDILVAVRDESDSIRKFVDQIKKINIVGVKISIIFLEDGSTDNTLDVLRTLSKELDFVRFNSLKNYLGQYVALFWGINETTADAVITMDVDGGHPVNVIEEMLSEYSNGYNVVQGHRILYRQKQKYRIVASNLYNLFVLAFVGINIVKQNSIFRLMDKKAYEIFKANSHWGYSLKTNFKKCHKIKIKYVTYNSPDRKIGESKYNFFRLARLSIRVIYSQLSLERLFISNFILLGLILLSLLYNNYLILIFCLSLMFFLTIPFVLFRRINPISKIKILESN